MRHYGHVITLSTERKDGSASIPESILKHLKDRMLTLSEWAPQLLEAEATGCPKHRHVTTCVYAKSRTTAPRRAAIMTSLGGCVRYTALTGITVMSMTYSRV
jgi:hypothetical protein